MNTEIAICILFFNKLEQTIECIESFLPSGNTIYVLNNGSDGDGRERLGRFCLPYRQVVLIDSPENVGACRGRNRLVREAKEDWLLFVDNDVRVSGNGWPEAMARHIEWHPETEVFIPRLYNVHEGSYQLHTVFKVVDNKVRFEFAEGETTNMFPGGASLIGRGMFSRLGLYDEDIFIGFEEFELALRGILSGAPVAARFVDDVKLIHDHRRLSREVDRLSALARYSDENMRRAHEVITRKHGVSMEQDYGQWLEDQVNLINGRETLSHRILRLRPVAQGLRLYGRLRYRLDRLVRRISQI